MLTPKQYELLTFIDRHLKQTGFSPSFEEMKDLWRSELHRVEEVIDARFRHIEGR